MSEKKKQKPRACAICGKRIVATAWEIKTHASTCGAAAAPKTERSASYDSRSQQ
jgi:hypothetical protein